MTIINQGVAKLITKIVLITEKNIDKKKFTDWGIFSSMVYISLENRLRIRPEGVVSKNDIGSRRILLSSRL